MFEDVLPVHDRFTECTPPPAPVRATLLVAFEALLVIVAVALKVPIAFGVKLTVTVVLCPAATVTGRVGETSVKNGVEIETLLTVTDVLPELVATNDNVAVFPSVTVPKFSVPLFRESVPLPPCVGDCAMEGPALTPWQAMRKQKRAETSRALAIFVIGLNTDLPAGSIDALIGPLAEWLT